MSRQDMTTSRQQVYVIQVQVPAGRWVDMQPLADDATHQARLNALDAWRQNGPTKRRWRLIKRTTIEEEMA